jgi:predicted Zn-dependent protease
VLARRVFGQAFSQFRVAAFSFARYSPTFSPKAPALPKGTDVAKLVLRRSVKVFLHETLHLLSLDHCVFW